MLRVNHVHLELCRLSGERLFLATLLNSPPYANCNKERQHCDSGDRSPNGNAPHGRAQGAALHWLLRRTRRSRPTLSIFRAVVTVLAMFGLVHCPPCSPSRPRRSCRSNSSSSSQVNSAFRKMLYTTGTKKSVANVSKIKLPMTA